MHDAILETVAFEMVFAICGIIDLRLALVYIEISLCQLLYFAGNKEARNMLNAQYIDITSDEMAAVV